MTSADMTSEELLGMLDHLTDLWESERPPAKIKARVSAAYLPEVFGLASHCVTLARAVAVLMRAGEPLAAVPLVRSIIECSVRAVWLQTFRELLPSVIHEDARQMKNTVDLVARLHPEYEDFPSLKQAASTMEQTRFDQTPSGRHFGQMCNDFVGGERVYAIYRMASAFVHPSFVMVDEYIQEVDKTAENSAGLVLMARSDFESGESWLGIAVTFLLHGLAAFDRVDHGHRLRSSLKEEATRFGVSTKWEQSAQGFVSASEMAKAQRDRRRARRRLPAQGAE